MRGIIEQGMFDCIPEIDFNTGCRYFVGNMDNYTMALLAMLKSIKAKLPLLDAMNYSGEYEGLRTITQTLRKMLSNIGATGLAEDTYQLETALLNGNFEGLQEELMGYMCSLTEFSEHLEQLLQKADVKGSVRHNEEKPNFLHYDFTKTKDSIRRSSDLLERRII
jgi:HPt (histidine-containing phosphotransfer) domain-containing protein